jgi:2-amino-4-hydroxy-6-hydroxymethyldihydropteridine diphosphokinase
LSRPNLYAVGIGSNRRHVRYGRPAGVVEAAIARLDELFVLFDASQIMPSKAQGGAGRDFANAIAVVESPLAPERLLDELKAIERSFGRRPGRRWGARVLDLDIVAWSGGRFRSRRLVVPHRALFDRAFVLNPLAAVAPHWTIMNGLTARHLAARGTRRRPVS